MASLNHQASDRVPIDFGGTSVTGIHVSCVAALRDFYGLAKRPVKVHEQYQMLGLLVRIPNENLERDIAELPTRPVGRPSPKRI